MKQFRTYIIYNCYWSAPNYNRHLLINIKYKLLQEIKKLFDLDEIILENALDNKFIYERF